MNISKYFLLYTSFYYNLLIVNTFYKLILKIRNSSQRFSFQKFKKKINKQICK